MANTKNAKSKNARSSKPSTNSNVRKPAPAKVVPVNNNDNRNKIIAIVIAIIVAIALLLALTCCNKKGEEKPKEKKEVKEEVKDETKDYIPVVEVYNNYAEEPVVQPMSNPVAPVVDKLAEAKKAVATARETLNANDIQTAQDLINNLPDSEDKNNLQDDLDKIKEIQQLTKILETVEAMVDEADSTDDVNSAVNFADEQNWFERVDALDDEDVKEDLFERMYVAANTIVIHVGDRYPFYEPVEEPSEEPTGEPVEEPTGEPVEEPTEKEPEYTLVIDDPEIATLDNGDIVGVAPGETMLNVYYEEEIVDSYTIRVKEAKEQEPSDPVDPADGDDNTSTNPATNDDNNEPSSDVPTEGV